jgi:predicted PurR-regulated permease PerM
MDSPGKIEPDQPKRPGEPAWSAGQLQFGLLLSATALGIYLCTKLTLPFVPAMTWALALAVLLHPIHRRLEVWLGNKSLAALLSVLLTALTVVAPIVWITARLIRKSASGAEMIAQQVASGEWLRRLESYPRLAPAVHWLLEQIDLPGAFQNAAGWLTNLGASFLRGSVVQFTLLLLTFYLLFYFLRDRQPALAAIRAIVPLSTRQMSHLFSRIRDTLLATLYGTFVVAAVQGTLGGLMFWWLGLPAPFLWGVVMGLLAVIPVLGAFIIWIPAALFLALEGLWGKSVILSVWGAVVVGGIDNLLYPVLVGNRLQMHTVVAFVSIVGGLIAFGPSGLVLGPVTVAVTDALLNAWSERAESAAHPEDLPQNPQNPQNRTGSSGAART